MGYVEITNQDGMGIVYGDDQTPLEGTYKMCDGCNEPRSFFGGKTVVLRGSDAGIDIDQDVMWMCSYCHIRNYK